MIKTYPTLYKTDTANRVRIWYMERDGGKHRSIAGLQDGKLVFSDWVVCEQKNVGRSNETSLDEQAEAEVESHYTKKKKKGWSETLGTGVVFFEPMLAEKKLPKKIEYPIFSQPKLDGIRCIAKRDGLWSRTGERIITCPHIENALTEYFDHHPNDVLDGELYNHTFKDDFNRISSLVKRLKIKLEDIEQTRKLIEYHVYDCYYGNNDPFEIRWDMFSNTAIKLPKCIRLVPTTRIDALEEIDDAFSSYMADGYEGQMIRLNGPYENKRSKNLIKIKTFQDEEFIVLDINAGKGNWSGKAKTIKLKIGNSDFSAGIRGNEEYLAQVLKEKHKYIGKPAKVRFQNLTPDGKPRFGVVVELNRTW